jgi:tryptophan synthase beta subunit
MKVVPTMDKDKVVVINLSGRGDKDTHTVMDYFRTGKQGLEALNK